LNAEAPDSELTGAVAVEVSPPNHKCTCCLKDATVELRCSWVGRVVEGDVDILEFGEWFEGRRPPYAPVD